jgi:hypothetical protein
MRFLRTVAGYRRKCLGGGGGGPGVPNNFNIGKEVEEYKLNYLEHIFMINCSPL